MHLQLLNYVPSSEGQKGNFRTEIYHPESFKNFCAIYSALCMHGSNINKSNIFFTTFSSYNLIYNIACIRSGEE